MYRTITTIALNPFLHLPFGKGASFLCLWTKNSSICVSAQWERRRNPPFSINIWDSSCSGEVRKSTSSISWKERWGCFAEYAQCPALCTEPCCPTMYRFRTVFEAFLCSWEWRSGLFVFYEISLSLPNQVRRKGKIMRIICGLFGALWFLHLSNRLIYWWLERLPLSAERTGQKWTESYKSLICSFFIARKSCFQDFKSTVKDKVSLLNRYLPPPTGQKR